jgi:hypothetical protein
MGLNNFTFSMTIEGREGDRELLGVNNSHHKLKKNKAKSQVGG